MRRIKEEKVLSQRISRVSLFIGIFFLISNLAASAVQSAGSGIPDLGDNASLDGQQIFPANNPWNQHIDAAPVDPNSAAVINRFASAGIHADFGANWDGGPFGIPYRVIAGTQPKVAIGPITYVDESDPGPYPKPADVPIEGGAQSAGGPPCPGAGS